MTCQRKPSSWAMRRKQDGHCLLGNIAHLAEAQRDPACALCETLKALWYLQRLWGLALRHDAKQARAHAALKVPLPRQSLT